MVAAMPTPLTCVPTPEWRNKLYEQVVSRIVDAILNGDHPPGSFLPPDEVARHVAAVRAAAQ